MGFVIEKDLTETFSGHCKSDQSPGVAVPSQHSDVTYDVNIVRDKVSGRVHSSTGEFSHAYKFLKLLL